MCGHPKYFGKTDSLDLSRTERHASRKTNNLQQLVLAFAKSEQQAAHKAQNIEAGILKEAPLAKFLWHRAIELVMLSGNDGSPQILRRGLA